MSEWDFIQIGKLGKVVTGKTPSINNPEQWGEEALFITPSDMKTDAKYISSTARKISKNGIQKFRSIFLPKNSVMVSCIGSDMGKVVVNQSVGVTNQQINSIIIDGDKNDYNFVYYALKYNYKLLRKFADGGSTMPILNKSTFESLEIFVPQEKEVQKKISIILSLLDQKITLLRQQNQDLEELAQTLFKRWFVEFEFPNENGEPYKSSGGKMGESELGEIPEGWRVKPLESILKIHNGYSYKGSELQESDIALVTLKNFDRNGGFRFDGFKELVSDNYKEKHIVKVGDLIVAHTDLTHDAEVLGNPAIVMKNDKYKELVVSMDLVKVESKLEEITTAFLYYLMRDKRFKSHCKGYSNGTTVLHLSKTAIPEYMFAFPEKMSLVKDFGFYAKSVYDKISINIEEIQTLTQLRDTLLPKLMSGELRVNI